MKHVYTFHQSSEGMINNDILPETNGEKIAIKTSYLSTWTRNAATQQ